MERNPAQTAFYKSSEWRRCRLAFLESRHYVCERCGRVATIAHHRTYLTPANVGDPSVTLNFANLEALCKTCHNKEHFDQGATAAGLAFDRKGNLVAS